MRKFSFTTLLLLIGACTSGGTNAPHSNPPPPPPAQSPAPIVNCKTNFCLTNHYTSGQHCDGTSSVGCSTDGNGCVVESSRRVCKDGCNTSGGAQAGYCTAAPPQPGDPVIQSTSGSLVDGSPITLTGTEFGSHTLDIEWTGGVDGKIEQRASGTLMKNFGAPWGESLSSGATPPAISTERAHSYGKAIKSWVDSAVAGSWQSGFDYKYPHRFSEFYATWWTYFEPILGQTNNCNGPQWKVWRVNDGPDSDRVNDTPGDLMLQANYAVDPWPGCSSGTQYRMVNIYSANAACSQASASCTADPLHDCMGYQGGSAIGCCNCNVSYTQNVDRYLSGSPEDGFLWTRWEVYGNRSSLDALDGKIQVWLTVSGQGRKLVADLSASAGKAVATHRDLSGDPMTGIPPWIHQYVPQDWVWFVWQNYWGNQISGTAGKANFFIDDIYLQVEAGGARIELGNQPNYADCTALEIQKPAAWTNGSITFDLNYGGSFHAGNTAYLFIINSAGHVSPGFAVSLGP